MGSFDEYEKGKSPSLNWVQAGIDRHNRAVRRRALACPMWRKLLCLVGIRKPYITWQQNEPLYRYKEAA